MVKRGQTALEFLMTYGWAILVVLVAVGALAYFGVLSPDKFLPNKCILPEITCLDFNIETKSVTLALTNNLGQTITINQVTVARKDSSCSNIQSRELKNNENMILTLTGCNNGNIGDKFDGSININYTKESGLVHTTSGRMTATISEGGDDGDGGENITCSNNQDCGTSGFVGDYYCVDNYITQNQLNYTCLNPGTVNSNCIVSNTSVSLTYCDPALNQTCVAGNASCQMNETTIHFEIVQITTNIADQEVPDIYGNKIVWADNSNIWMYDLSTNQETKITTQAISAYVPAIYGDKIVYADETFSNRHDIWVYDLSTGEETKLTMEVEDQINPRIYGNKIVWGDERVGHWEVFMYDLYTSQETRITTSGGGLRYRPSIYDDKIVWDDYSNKWNIYMYDLSSGQQTLIPTDTAGANVGTPDIYNNKIVYSNTYDIYMYDLFTSLETLITTQSGNALAPSIYDNKIVWEDYRNGNADIYMYDLSTNQEVQITNNTADQMVPRIYDNKIVWMDYRNGNWDIYMATIS